MFDFLSCSFGSVLGGLLTAILVAGGLLVFSTQFTKRGSIEPIALILCGILFCVLFYQITLMYAAIGNKGVAMDFISALHLQFGSEINGSELRDTMTTLIRENPLIAFFIDYGDLENFDWSQPIKSLRDIVAREYNWYIFRRIVWTLVFTAITFVIIFLTSVGGGKKRKRKITFDDEFDFLDFD